MHELRIAHLFICEHFAADPGSPRYEIEGLYDTVFAGEPFICKMVALVSGLPAEFTVETDVRLPSGERFIDRYEQTVRHAPGHPRLPTAVVFDFHECECGDVGKITYALRHQGRVIAETILQCVPPPLPRRG